MISRFNIFIFITSILLIIPRSFAEVKNKQNEKNEFRKILFVGDSVTSILNYRTGKKITSTYPNIVAEKLISSNIKVDVLAKGGETTIWMLKELRSKLENNEYERIYFYGGINDAWNKSIKPETTLGNVEKIIDLIKSDGSEAYVILGYETNDFMDYKKMPVTRYQKSQSDNIELIMEYKNYQDDLIKLYEKRKDFHIIPKINMAKKTHDGIHPNAEGQKMIAEAVLKTF